MAPQLSDIAKDLHLSNPTIPTASFLDLLQKAETWLYEWGAIMAVGYDMHIHIMTGYRRRVMLRKPLREVADAMFKRYDTLTTSVMKTKPEALQFDLRMGWKLVDETEHEWHLKMTKEDFNYGKS